VRTDVEKDVVGAQQREQQRQLRHRELTREVPARPHQRMEEASHLTNVHEHVDDARARPGEVGERLADDGAGGHVCAGLHRVPGGA